MLFANRKDAADRVAEEVRQDLGFDGMDSVIGLARGGVIISSAVASKGNLPMSVLLVDDNQSRSRQVFVSPFGNGMVRIYGGSQKKEVWVTDANSIQDQAVPSLLHSVGARQQLYNGALPQAGRRVLLCDDGIVSGKTVRFAAQTIRQFLGVERIILVTPVIPSGMTPGDVLVDDVIFVHRSSLSHPPTGLFYREFADTPDEEVIALARQHHPAS